MQSFLCQLLEWVFLGAWHRCVLNQMKMTRELRVMGRKMGGRRPRDMLWGFGVKESNNLWGALKSCIIQVPEYAKVCDQPQGQTLPCNVIALERLSRSSKERLTPQVLDYPFLSYIVKTLGSNGVTEPNEDQRSDGLCFQCPLIQDGISSREIRSRLRNDFPRHSTYTYTNQVDSFTFSIQSGEKFINDRSPCYLCKTTPRSFPDAAQNMHLLTKIWWWAWE